MTNSIAQILGATLIVVQVVLAFLLSQSDVVFEPLVRVILGATSAGVTALALYLNVRMPGQDARG